MPEGPKVAINGFGRIGRLVGRALLELEMPVQLVAVNDLGDPEMLAHLFKYDSVHGKWEGDVSTDGKELQLGEQRVRVFQERDPANLPWKDLGVDYVIESTGHFRDREGLKKHLDAGAKRVILSAPGKGVDITLVRGVNGDQYDPETHRIISNASCTTNCLAPVLKVLHERFGVEHAAMTTVHAYTNDQVLLDTAHKDYRRARAAAVSMIPTSTGAATAVGKVLPDLEGKVDGLAVRVPIVNGSLVDVTAKLQRNATEDDLKQAFHEAANAELAGILAVEPKPLVSVDFNHNPASAVVDFPSLMTLDGGLVKVLAWYDNEWGYSNRTAELVHDLWAHDSPEAEVPATH